MVLDNLHAVADFLVQKRELTLAADVRRFVHLVSYRQGSIVFVPGSGAPHDLATRLSKTLSELTNMAWLVSVEAGAQGAPSLASQQSDQRAHARNALDQHPGVLAVKKVFAGAKIVKVRKKPSQNGDPT